MLTKLMLISEPNSQGKLNMQLSEFQIRIPNNDGPTLADIRRENPTLATTYYSEKHPSDYVGQCICKHCRDKV